MINIYKVYGFLGTIKLVKSALFTKIFFPSARLIRFPFDIRGKCLIKWGTNFRAGFGCRIEAYSTTNNVILTIGNDVQLNDYVHITAMEKVTIGDNVLIASKVYISDSSHGSYAGDSHDSHPQISPQLRAPKTIAVIIENNVWIGESVSILPGVCIGEGSIIGANTVVTKSIPPFSIAVGNPAKVIKKFDFDKNCWILN